MQYLLLFLVVILLISKSIPQSNLQTAHTFQKEIKITLSSNYLLYLPAGYNDNNDKYPLVLFLHGIAERGNDLEKIKIHGLPKLINAGKEFPFIVVSPQCPDDMFWNTDALSALVDEIETNFRVNKNRIYVTGLSMGGHATWSLAIAQPNRFAAIAPICGWSNPTMACSLKHLPIWVFHGAKDMAVPISASQQMVDKLKSCGADVKFTVYPEANHDSWTETYNNEELYSWFLQHSLNEDK